MGRFGGVIAVTLAFAVPGAALAGAAGFTLVNGTGSAISGVSIKRTGTAAWTSLGAAASPGARTKVAFTDPDCAFDLKASVGGAGETVWSGVNLCEVSSVTLHRDASGLTWVDYD